jgi:hypothetical protein
MALVLTPWYAQPEAIERAFRDGYESFRSLCEEREAAHYQRKETLRNWYRGRFHLDTYGNTWWCEDPTISVPGVLGKVDFGKVVTYTLFRMPKESCPLCKRPWTLQDVGTEYHGMHRHCENIRATHHFYGVVCDILQPLGVPYKLVRIPNRYWPDHAKYGWAPDWCELHFPGGVIVTTGQRKNVLSIEWQGPDLFPDCADTHEKGLVHAWNRETYAERLRTVVEHLTRAPA